jgi:hypothetical protein
MSASAIPFMQMASHTPRIIIFHGFASPELEDGESTLDEDIHQTVLLFLF